VSSHYYDSWSLGVTKEGGREFFFNRATGAVRWAGESAVGPMNGMVVNYGMQDCKDGEGEKEMASGGGDKKKKKKKLYKISCGMRAGSHVADVDPKELQTFLEMQLQPVLTKEAATRILGRQKELEAKLLLAQQHAYHYKYILYQKQQKEAQLHQQQQQQQQQRQRARPQGFVQAVAAKHQQAVSIRNPPSSSSSASPIWKSASLNCWPQCLRPWTLLAM